MEIFAIVLFISLSFSAGVIYGFVWAQMHYKAKSDFEITDNPSQSRRCHRCGQIFDINLTDDPENRLCHPCMNYLEKHPEDPYWEVMANQ